MKGMSKASKAVFAAGIVVVAIGISGSVVWASDVPGAFQPQREQDRGVAAPPASLPAGRKLAAGHRHSRPPAPPAADAELRQRERGDGCAREGGARCARERGHHRHRPPAARAAAVALKSTLRLGLAHCPPGPSCVCCRRSDRARRVASPAACFSDRVGGCHWCETAVLATALVMVVAACDPLLDRDALTLEQYATEFEPAVDCTNYSWIVGLVGCEVDGLAIPVRASAISYPGWTHRRPKFE